MSAYDVIVIGSGAGGGTLVRQPRAVRQAASCCSSAATGCRASRRTGTPRRRVRRQPLRVARTPGTTATGSRSSRRCTTSSAARPSSTARRCTACARRTSARCATTTASRPRWPIAYDEIEPYYTLAEQLYQVHGARGEDPTEPPASAPYPFPAVSHEPRIQQLADDLEAAGHQPVPRALRGHARRGATCRYSACVRCATCDGFPCLVHAKSDADVLGGAAGAASTRTSRCDRTPRPCGWRPTRRARPSPAWSSTATASARPSPATSSWSPAARRTAPSCCSRRPARRIRNGLANGSDQVGRNYMFHNSQAVLALSKEREPDRLPEDARAQRLLLRHQRLRVPDGEHPDGRQVVGARCTAARSRCRPGWRPSGRSRRSPATPSTSGSRPRTSHGPRTA